jgi:hypothetical protein
VRKVFEEAEKNSPVITLMKLIAQKHEKGRGDTPYTAVDLMLDKQRSQVSRCLAIINTRGWDEGPFKEKIVVIVISGERAGSQAENIIYGTQLRLA